MTILSQAVCLSLPHGPMSHITHEENLLEAPKRLLTDHEVDIYHVQEAALDVAKAEAEVI